MSCAGLPGLVGVCGGRSCGVAVDGGRGGASGVQGFRPVRLAIASRSRPASGGSPPSSLKRHGPGTSRRLALPQVSDEPTSAMMYRGCPYVRGGGCTPILTAVSRRAELDRSASRRRSASTAGQLRTNGEPPLSSMAWGGHCMRGCATGGGAGDVPCDVRGCLALPILASGAARRPSGRPTRARPRPEPGVSLATETVSCIVDGLE